MKKAKLTWEQEKLLKDLQDRLGAKGLSNIVGDKPKRLTAKSIFIKYLGILQGLIPTIDKFIKFVIESKIKSEDRSPVEQARSPILFGLIIITIFVIGGGVWSGVAPLDKAAGAMGMVISSTKKKVIQHREGGIIKDIFIQEGQIVSVGDKLVELDDRQVKSSYNAALNQYRTAIASESRLVAERDSLKDIIFNEQLLEEKHLDEIEKIIQTQKHIFETRRKFNEGYYEAEETKIAQNKKQIDSLNAQLKAHNKNLIILQERIRSTESLLEEGFAEKKKLLDLQSNEADLQSKIAVVKSDILRTRQEISKIEINIINYKNDFLSKVLSELKEKEQATVDLQQKYLAIKDTLDRSIIRSPVEGIVNSVRVHTKGGVIGSGGEIVEISPLKDTLEIEAKIPERYIDSVRVGLKAKLRFSAFKARTTPVFTGKVIALSPDIVEDRQDRMMAAQFNNPMISGDARFYVARIAIDMEEFSKIAKASNLSLIPGMQAEIQIITGKRTLLRYMLDPVLDNMFRSFREK